MQSLSLESKIRMTQQRIRGWYEHWNGQVYVSFSGGKDSTVLKHIVDGMYSDVPAVFVNTGLEYPEIQSFVRDIKAGKYDCFNSDIEIIRPEMRFDEVIKKYGFPVISKQISRYIEGAKRWKKNNPNGSIKDATVDYKIMFGKLEHKEKGVLTGEYSKMYDKSKYSFMVDAPFNVSHKCCNVMKKKPLKKYVKKSNRKPMTAQMAHESHLRKMAWMKNGCNAFESNEPISNPLSFWTEQDILHYIKKYNVPYCSVYGDIVIDEKVDGENVLEGQMNMIDYLGCHTQEDKLKTTGCNRTGCIFCCFGITQDGNPNRFQRLKETHPRQYEYCIGGGEYNEDGMWQPSKEGLGLAKVLEYIGVKYE